MNRLLSILCVSALSALSVSAADLLVPFPAGYEPNWHLYDARAGNLVVAIHPTGNESTSRVFQVRSSQNLVTTDIAGDVRWLEYAPDGQHLLVGHNPEATGQSWTVTVIDSQGQIQTLIGPEKGFDEKLLRQLDDKHLALDRAGNLILLGKQLFMYSLSEGKLSGTGIRLRTPHGVYVHRSGTIYVVDTGKNRILKVERKQP